jgi:hypothetical protein
MRHRIAIVERGQSEMACPGRPMIQTVAENKYSFSMRVSAAAMAVPDRDPAASKSCRDVATFDKAFQPIGVRRDAVSSRKWPMESCLQRTQTIGLHDSVRERLSLSRAGQNLARC